MKKYKALMLDLDGTTIPNRKDGVPSQKVIEAIARASKIVKVGIATARPLFMVSHILDKLELSGPLIINSGAEIIDSKTRKTLYEQVMDENVAKTVCELLVLLKINFLIHDLKENVSYTDKYIIEKPSHIFVPDITHVTGNLLIKKLENISSIAVHKVPSWSKGKIGLLISHTSATKQHAILKVSELLKIETHNIIGVGDGYNDFPLLMACGLKVAMGNAVPELKEIADYIAPSVQDDGVVWVIEKFILPH
ncbi:MAG TPA: HAD-IIB family hydrolase [Candidatus Saccharimonadales bacterium]|nr:HAD-IIB family hydrolase [Candidatus Saccharimonadales bacterium]